MQSFHPSNRESETQPRGAHCRCSAPSPAERGYAQPMITLEELGTAAAAPSTAERRPIAARSASGCRLVASEKRVFAAVRWAGSCRACPALLPNSNALISLTKSPVLVQGRRQFRWRLFLGSVWFSLFGGNGLAIIIILIIIGLRFVGRRRRTVNAGGIDAGGEELPQ